jgi:hypothetical protein
MQNGSSTSVQVSWEHFIAASVTLEFKKTFKRSLLCERHFGSTWSLEKCAYTLYSFCTLQCYCMYKKVLCKLLKTHCFVKQLKKIGKRLIFLKQMLWRCTVFLTFVLDFSGVQFQYCKMGGALSVVKRLHTATPTWIIDSNPTNLCLRRPTQIVFGLSNLSNRELTKLSVWREKVNILAGKW